MAPLSLPSASSSADSLFPALKPRASSLKLPNARPELARGAWVTMVSDNRGMLSFFVSRKEAEVAF